MSVCSVRSHCSRSLNMICVSQNCSSESRYCCSECTTRFHSNHSDQCYTFDEIREFIEKANLSERFHQSNIEQKEKQVIQFFDMIRSQVLKKIRLQEESLLKKFARITIFRNLEATSKSNTFLDLKIEEIDKLREIIFEQTKLRGNSWKKKIINLIKGEDNKKQINDEEQLIWNEIHREQQAILEALSSYINLSDQMYKIGDPFEKDRFKSPIISVQEFFNQKRLQYDSAPNDYSNLRGQDKNQCFKMENGDLYQGEILNGRPHGRGILIKKDGSIYEGIFDWGEIKWGAHYWWDKLGCVGFEQGCMMDWQLHGKGQKQLATNENQIFEGQFYLGKLCGIGIYISENGDMQAVYIAIQSYEGELLNSERHGKGTLKNKNGDNYIGYWQNNKKHGEGKFYYVNGDMQCQVEDKIFDSYQGEFINDQREGKGTIYCISGVKYEGDWKNDKKNGFGVISYKNGQKYAGEMMNDKKHGKGTFYYQNGERYEGSWKNGKISGFGIHYYVNGDRYEGFSKNNVRYGKGTYFFSDGRKYIGEYKDDMREGSGVFYFLNGGREEGQYFKGNPIGVHVYIKQNNEIQSQVKITLLIKRKRLYDNEGNLIKEEAIEK